MIKGRNLGLYFPKLELQSFVCKWWVREKVTIMRNKIAIMRNGNSRKIMKSCHCDKKSHLQIKCSYKYKATTVKF